MHPARQILLVGDNEDRVSLLRYILRNSSDHPDHSRYVVTSAYSTEEAIEAIKEKEYDLMLVLHPIAALKDLLNCSRSTYDWMPIIVLSETLTCGADNLYDAWLCNVKNEILLEWISGMTKRQKGPRKGSPAAYRCGKSNKVLSKEVVSEFPVGQVEEVVA